MSKEEVQVIEKEENQAEPESTDIEDECLHYSNIELASGVTAKIDYNFSKENNNRLISVFIFLPITEDNQESLLSYLRSTFPEVQEDSGFSLSTDLYFTKKNTNISLFHADNSNNYCISLMYRYEQFFE